MTYLYIACIGNHSLSLALSLYYLHPPKACIQVVTWTYPILGDSLIDAGSEWRSRQDDEERRCEGWPELHSELPMEKDREDSWRRSLPRRLDIISAFCLFSFSPRGLYSEIRNTIIWIIVLNKFMWCCKCEKCLWYAIEMSSVCDSYWSRDYHNNTESGSPLGNPVHFTTHAHAVHGMFWPRHAVQGPWPALTRPGCTDPLLGPPVGAREQHIWVALAFLWCLCVVL